MRDEFAARTIRTLVCLCGIFAGMEVQSDALIDGSAEDGESKAVTCGACHGADGNSVNPAWPSIAGQHAQYIVDSLQSFKDGSRSDVLMSGQSMILQEQDMKDLGAYFSSQAAAAKSVADPALLDKGENLYRGGDKESSAAACIACHGPTGRGNPAASYPSLRGQYAVYTAKQLRDYASDTRKSDRPTKVMRDIASRLSEEDIVAVSSYIQGLR
jgi:cytochrome c553